MIGSMLDTALDRSIVAGYTSLGYRIRSRGWDPTDVCPMPGQAVLVTGASSGLGFAAAEGFAGLGAAVWLLVRDSGRCDRERERIVVRSGNPDRLFDECE